MSFVAEAAAGSRRKGYRSGGEGTWGGAKEFGGGLARKCYPGNHRAPPRTRIESSEIQIIIMTMRKKKATAISQRKRLSRSKIIFSDPEKARNNGSHTGLVANDPRDPLGPSAVAEVLSLDRRGRRTLLAAPPEGTPHPVHGSGDGSQRIRSASADLHRQRRSPARRALRPQPPFSSPNKHPSPEVTSLPSLPPAPPLVLSALPSEATRERTREKGRPPPPPQSSCRPSCTRVHAQRPFLRTLVTAGERWECCHVFLGKPEWSWASVPACAHSSRMMGSSEWGS